MAVDDIFLVFIVSTKNCPCCMPFFNPPSFLVCDDWCMVDAIKVHLVAHTLGLELSKGRVRGRKGKGKPKSGRVFPEALTQSVLAGGAPFFAGKHAWYAHKTP